MVTALCVDMCNGAIVAGVQNIIRCSLTASPSFSLCAVLIEAGLFQYLFFDLFLWHI